VERAFQPRRRSLRFSSSFPLAPPMYRMIESNQRELGNECIAFENIALPISFPGDSTR
jgi:hypothetical protein